MSKAKSESPEQPESVEPNEPTTECSICGHVPGPFQGCLVCHGNETFIAPRAFTLTEERAKPKDESRTGDIGPKTVNLPGSFDPRTSS